MTIEMYNKPRRSGKTSMLKLYGHELHNNFDYTIVYGHNTQQTEELYYYFRQYFTIVTNLRGIRCSKILMLIDEPFLFSKEKESQLMKEIEDLELRGSIVHVIGIGTLVSNIPFSTYIKK